MQLTTSLYRRPTVILGLKSGIPGPCRYNDRAVHAHSRNAVVDRQSGQRLAVAIQIGEAYRASIGEKDLGDTREAYLKAEAFIKRYLREQSGP
jgi:hypothetical protein